MSLSDKEKVVFERFLTAVDRQIVDALGSEAALQLFMAIVDFSLTADDFNVRLASVFRDNPEDLKRPEVMEVLKSVTSVRSAMRKEYKNSEESRAITVQYFLERIKEIENEDIPKNVKIRERLQTAHDDLMVEQRSRKKSLKDQLQRLQEERQRLHDVEIEEQKERRQEKKRKENKLKNRLQAEYEQSVEERKERRRMIEEEIEELQVKLQEDHERQIEERKEDKKKRGAEMRERQQRQHAEQERQAMKRKREKDKDKMMMQARQQVLLEQQIKQRKERMNKKKNEENQQRLVQQEVRRRINTPGSRMVNKTSASKPIVDMEDDDFMIGQED